MNDPREQLANRRGFFRATGRYVAATALGVFVIGQEVKARRLKNDPNCIKLSTCRDCIEFNHCNKDKADRFRRGQIESSRA